MSIVQRYPCAEPITATITASETKSPGGREVALIPSPRRGCSGFRRDVLNKAAGIYSLPAGLPPVQTRKKLLRSQFSQEISHHPFDKVASGSYIELCAPLVSKRSKIG
jgi:hypothetical protein